MITEPIYPPGPPTPSIASALEPTPFWCVHHNQQTVHLSSFIFSDNAPHTSTIHATTYAARSYGSGTTGSYRLKHQARIVRTSSARCDSLTAGFARERQKPIQTVNPVRLLDENSGPPHQRRAQEKKCSSSGHSCLLDTLVGGRTFASGIAKIRFHLREHPK